MAYKDVTTHCNTHSGVLMRAHEATGSFFASPARSPQELKSVKRSGVFLYGHF